MSTTSNGEEVLRRNPLSHPYAASSHLFEYPHSPGPHLRKIYNAVWKAIDPAFPNAPTRICILLPRGSGKSESAGVVTPTWLALRYPEIRTAVIGKTKGLAEERTKKAVEYIDQHAESFGVELEKPLPRTEVDTRSNPHKELTLAPYGLESQLTGKHFDVIIWDDIADWENQRTATQRRNVRNYFKDYEKNLPDSDSDLPQGPVQIMIGTRKHPQDIYETDIFNSNRWHVIQHKAIKESDWPLVEQRAWKVKGTDGQIYDGVQDLPHGVQVAPDGVIPDHPMTVLWPERRPPERVLYDLVDGDDSLAIWRRENQLDPQALSGEVFKSEWIDYVEELPKPPSSYDWHAAMDVAVVEDLQQAAENDSDYSSVAVAAVDQTGAKPELYYLPPRHARGMSVGENIAYGERQVNEMLEPYGVELSDYVVEANKAPGVGQGLRDDTDLPARPVDSTDSKDTRIHDFSAQIEKANAHFIGSAQDETWRSFEVNEYLQFPNAGHVDRLDVMAILYREVKGGGRFANPDEVNVF